jgi:hypothetical protein
LYTGVVDGRSVVLKVFDKIEGVTDGDVAAIFEEIVQLAARLKQEYEGDVELVVPEKLVRINGGGLGLLSRQIKGLTLEELEEHWTQYPMDYIERYPDFEDLKSSAVDFLRKVDELTGGLADVRYSKNSALQDYLNFVFLDGKLYNVDPVEMRAVMARGADKQQGGIDLTADRITLERTSEGARFNLPQVANAPWSANINGLSPVIISITPISGLREFAGLK